MIAIAAALSIGGLITSSFLGPKRHNRVKLENYERGMETVLATSGRERFPIKYYLTATTSTVSDIEVVFLYPWVVSFHRLGLSGVVATLSFVFLVVVPLVYEWRHGGFERD